MVEIEEICCESNVNDALIFSMSTHHLFEGKKGNYEYEQMMSILPRVGMTQSKMGGNQDDASSTRIPA